MTVRLNTSSFANPTSTWLLLIAAVWIAIFLGEFFHQPLHDPDLRRTDLVQMMVLGVDADNSGSFAATPTGFRFLPQRLPLFQGALVLLALAAAHGDAVCVLSTRRIRLFWSERIVISLGTGLAILSLVTLCCGLLGQLNPKALAIPSAVSVAISVVVRLLGLRRTRSRVEFPVTAATTSSPILVSLVMLVLVPFAIYLLLGSVSPPTDFDVREYHLQGPKEWFQQGRVTFLSHNVYTSFPFLSEMLCLAGMVIAGDWWQGALVGQIVLACFQLLSTLCVFAISRRWISTNVAWLAALIYLTTPWTLRISLIAYAEGALTFFLVASIMTALLASVEVRKNRWLVLLCGLMAGSAMASKYTGLVSAILPTAVVLGWSLRANRQTQSPVARPGSWLQSGWFRTVIAGCCFGTGVSLMIAPWLLRNLHDTGNPVYPLGYTIFGGTEWSSDMNARWTAAHSPTEHSVAEIPRHVLDVAMRNKWTSGLLFALAVPSVLLLRRRRVVAIVLGVSAWELFAWWALTHRIDRFWIPVIPLLSIASASTWILSRSGLWRSYLGAILTIVTAFNLYFCSLTLVGFHVGLMDLQAARQKVIRSDISSLNRSLPNNAKVLMVGDAEVFDATFPLVYNTVFDECLFEAWTSNPEDSQLPAQQRRMLSPKQIRADFRARGITHVLVHWGEILRYRLPGSYGFTDYVQPVRFDQLVKLGVLNPPGTLLGKSWQDLSGTERTAVESWNGFKQLILRDETLAVVQLFEVQSQD